MWRRWTLASFLGRLPTTMTLLALVLAGQQAAGSLAVGAQLAGTATVVAGLAAPWRGRRLDRSELRSGLQRACAATAAVLTAEALALLVGAPVAVLYVLAVCQGLASAAISGGFRALLVPVVPPDDLSRANVVEAVFVEVAFVAGPALAALLALLVGPAGVLLAMAMSASGSALVARGLPLLYPPSQRAAVAPWRLRSARPVFVLALAMGICLGLLESAVPPRVEELGAVAAVAGWLLALVAAGSGLGGLLASARADVLRGPRREAIALLAGFAVLLVPVALAGGLPLLAGVLLLAGLPIAPLNALGALMLQVTVPAGRQAEGFAVYIAAILLGAGFGQLATGALLDRTGAVPLILGAAGLPLLGALMLLAWPLMRRRRSGLWPGPTLDGASGTP